MLMLDSKHDIPMKYIFGFMDDYSKVTYGMRDTLQLIRKDDDDALFRIAAAECWESEID